MPPNVINSALKFIENILHKFGKDIQNALKGEMADVSTSIDKSTKQQSAIFSRAVGKLETAINKIKEPKFTGDISVDTKKLEQELKRAVTDLKTSIKPVKLDNLELILREIKKSLKANSDAQATSFNSGLRAIAESLADIELIVPKTVKIDDAQFRSLNQGGSGGYGGPLPARSSLITPVTMASANTEYSHTFNKSVVSWRMKLEATNASFNYSWTTGKLKISGDASSYISIPASWLDSRDGVEHGAKTIYFESGSSSQKMQIEENIA